MKELYEQIAKDLVKVFHYESALFFPKYYNNDTKEHRVSEQESKILFARLFFNNHIPFSIEAPTKSKHSFTGENPQSASYDMVLYDKPPIKGHEPAIQYAIELKAHNPEHEKIRKDIEKFACSGLDCIWFHTLEKADSNTYKTLFQKINDSIRSEKEKIKGKHRWDFVIVSLAEKNANPESKLYISSIEISPSFDFHDFDIKDFQKVDLN